ncbi:MAG: hypothetical protein IPI63_11810 [Methanothrix sp.]|nr:hypothetical protein [Methanothrix sp.]MBK7387348.1 hypothetical protein [Methanothrix sp.]
MPWSNEEIFQCMRENEIVCPECGGELSTVYEFNLMFKTMIGLRTRWQAI